MATSVKPVFLTDSAPMLVPDAAIALTRMSAPTQERRTRYKLWELQSCWHCMVIGTCLTLSDVRQAAIKVSLATKETSDYAVHQLAVECAADKSHRLTQHLQKRLDKMYAAEIKAFRSAKTPDTLLAMWNDGWKSGQVAGSLWALITNQLATRDIIQVVFGEVHMMSHLSGASICVDRKRLVTQERKIDALNDELLLVRNRAAQTSQTLIDNKKSLDESYGDTARLRSQLTSVQADSEKLTSQPCSKTTLSDALVLRLRTRVAELQHSNNDLQLTNVRQAKEIDRLNRLVASTAYQQPDQRDENLKLCGQCVLYLGGKAQQRRHFQALVESCDGRFLHHDGGRESCPHRIAELVSQADVVMCPTDCISHRAMEKARSLCAKQDKPIVFMKRASLSTFTQSLHQALG